jgi:hypothetical protein
MILDISKDLKIKNESSCISDLKEKINQMNTYKKIASIIRATTFNHVPQTLLEKNNQDADYFHFTLDNYSIKCNLLRKKWESTSKAEFTDLEWAKENLKVLITCIRLCYYKLAVSKRKLDK